MDPETYPILWPVKCSRGTILYAKVDLKINRNGIDYFVLKGSSAKVCDIEGSVIYLVLDDFSPLTFSQIYPLVYYPHRLEEDWTTASPTVYPTLWERLLQ